MKVLVVAAHPDDEILGVGGTLLKHKKNGDSIYVCMVTTSYSPEWSDEYRKQKLEEAKKVDKLLGVKKKFFCELPTVKLNTIPHGEISKKIMDIVDEVKPDLVYTHFEHDVNLDHGIIYRAVLVATRPIKQRIKLLCYETMSSTEWGGKAFMPNHYVEINDFIDKKIEAFSLYKSEVKKFPHPRSNKGIRAWAQKRGSEICTEHAEAFRIIRSYG